MNNNEVRGWKDLDARSLETVHPAGEIAETLRLFGGQKEIGTEHYSTLGCCNGFTNEATCGFWC